MKTFNKGQPNDSIILEGEKAAEAAASYHRFQDAAQAACEELHEAVARVESLFQQAGDKAAGEIQSILRGTDFEDIEPSEVGFDMSLYEKHGIVVGKQLPKKPNIAEFLKAILGGDAQAMKDAGYTGEPFDGIVAEEIKGSDSNVSKRWKEPASA